MLCVIGSRDCGSSPRDYVVFSVLHTFASVYMGFSSQCINNLRMRHFHSLYMVFLLRLAVIYC